MLDALVVPWSGFLNRIVRRNSFFTWLLFRVHVKDEGRIHWDFTTLALKKSLSHEPQSHQAILEIGTGPYALLAIDCARRSSGNITASDVRSSYCESARRTAALNSARLKIIQSDLFDKLSGVYDLILFNAVYIPRALGFRLQIARFHASESDWCGGDEGWEMIDRFLAQAREHLTPAGKILLGFNPLYLPKPIVEQRCRQNGYKIINQFVPRFNPSIALILQRGD
jgi:methylase of polypeptide subunit release factors